MCAAHVLHVRSAGRRPVLKGRCNCTWAWPVSQLARLCAPLCPVQYHILCSHPSLDICSMALVSKFVEQKLAELRQCLCLDLAENRLFF